MGGWNRLTIEQALDSYEVDASTGCWNWTRGKTSCGYGHYAVSGRQGRAHRLFYEHLVGEIPSRMHVCHRCDNPLCVNPEHLFVGSSAANTADKVSKGRQARGAELPQSRFSELQVRAVRELHATSGWTFGELAVVFAVTRPAIAAIVHRRTWRHVPDPIDECAPDLPPARAGSVA